MIPIILFCFVMLILVFLINYKLDREDARLYDYFVCTICGICINISFYISYSKTRQPNPGTLILVLIVLMSPQLITRDYIQYRKNKDDIKANRHFIKQSVIWVVTVMFLAAAAIYCYAVF